MVAVALKIKAHEWPIKSMAVLADGPRILTGSADCTVKVRTLLLMKYFRNIISYLFKYCYYCGMRILYFELKIPLFFISIPLSFSLRRKVK